MLRTLHMSPHATLEAVRTGLFLLFTVWENEDREVKPLAQGHRATKGVDLGPDSGSVWLESLEELWRFAETDGYCVPTPCWAKRFLWRWKIADCFSHSDFMPEKNPCALIYYSNTDFPILRQQCILKKMERKHWNIWNFGSDPYFVLLELFRACLISLPASGLPHLDSLPELPF